MSRYGMILLVIYFLDLAGTALGIHFKYIKEANPIIKWSLTCWGLSGFIIAKTLYLIFMIALLELSAKRSQELKIISPRRLKNYYRFAIFSYLFILCLGSLAFSFL